MGTDYNELGKYDSALYIVITSYSIHYTKLYDQLFTGKGFQIAPIGMQRFDFFPRNNFV